jgi:hypothetical protein
VTEPFHLLADADGLTPWLSERGGTRRNGRPITNLVVAYGPPPAPAIRVGTWDGGHTGPEPTAAELDDRARRDIADRLILAATDLACGLPGEEVERRMAETAAALAPWRPTVVRIDGHDHEAWLTGVGEHEIAYTLATGRCVFVHARGRPVPAELVTCADQGIQDALISTIPSAGQRHPPGPLTA